ncbi:hypothetical protein [Nocardiopsis halotolerans]|uniref:hypothetical protein n=1 Tax=Nocardiopsis halotolerans TaxID=124252 RepID=UPI00034922EC|nr:hypothetical protein [Nocardiopsis halotolerans]
MTPTRLAVATALALLVATGCGVPREWVPTGAGESAGEGRTPRPTAQPGPRPGEPGADRGPAPEESPEPAPTTEPGGGSPSEGAESGTSGEGVRAVAASGDTVAAYVDALTRAGDPERMREGLRYTAEGSAAHAYLAHRAAVVQAWADGGRPAWNVQARRTADGYELCHGGEPRHEASCVSYGGFTAEDGLLTELLVDGRDPGPDLLVADGVTDGSEGVRAELLTAYRSATSKTLVVTVEFTTEDDVSLDLLQATYEGEREHLVEEAVGRFELDGGSSTHAAFFFPGATPGGTLTVGGCLAECSALVDVELPVR